MFSPLYDLIMVFLNTDLYLSYHMCLFASVIHGSIFYKKKNQIMYSASLGDQIETELCTDTIFETGLSIQTPSSSDRLSDRHLISMLLCRRCACYGHLKKQAFAKGPFLIQPRQWFT